MFRLFLMLPVFLVFNSVSLTAFAATEKLSAEEAKIGHEVLRDLSEKARNPQLQFLVGNNCDTSRPGAGVCWKRCNYSISSCATSCGVTSDEGSGECWNRCTYSISSCAQICGTQTKIGNGECWNRCTYSIQSCSQICGT